MNDALALSNLILSGINLVFILRIILNDLRHLDEKLDRHLDFSESLHREIESRLSVMESRKPS